MLLDECVPSKLRRELAEHEVLTVDQNLKYQQNLKAFNIAIILLVARNNRLRTLLPLMPEVRRVLENIQAGDFVRVGVSSRGSIRTRPQ